MDKCLVTKLRGSVNNPNLIKLDELRIKVNNTSVIYLQDIINARVANGYFTDITHSQNLGTSISGKTAIYPTGGSTLFLSPKSKITSLKGSSMANVLIMIEDLAYIGENAEILWFEGCLSGNIDSLVGKNPIAFDAKNCPNIYGNLSSIANKDITKIDLQNSNVTGLVSDLINCKKLTSLGLPSKVSGDVSIFDNTFSELTSISSEGSTRDHLLTGDLSKLNSQIKYVSFAGHATNFTWKGTRTGKIISFDSCNFGNDVDAVLINMANLEADSTYKAISISGTRTSASDAAVQTLQSKGYTVSVTPA